MRLRKSAEDFTAKCANNCKIVKKATVASPALACKMFIDMKTSHSTTNLAMLTILPYHAYPPTTHARTTGSASYRRYALALTVERGVRL